jgi:hypothetical protein
MEENPDIIFFSIPICPKCKTVESHIKSILEENQDLSIKKINLITNLGTALDYGISTVPALIIKRKTLTGQISKEMIEKHI